MFFFIIIILLLNNDLKNKNITSFKTRYTMRYTSFSWTTIPFKSIILVKIKKKNFSDKNVKVWLFLQK